MNLSRDTNTSHPSYLRTQSWVSVAYDAAAQGQGDDPEHAANGNHPDVVINTDDNSEKVKVSANSPCVLIWYWIALSRGTILSSSPRSIFSFILQGYSDFMLLINALVPWRKQLAMFDCFFGHASKKEKTPNDNTMLQRGNAIC